MSGPAVGAVIAMLEERQRDHATPICTRIVGTVTQVVETPGETFVLYRPRRVFVWVKGCPDLGRHLPAGKDEGCALLGEFSVVLG